MALDSRTVVQVRYERNARKLELLSGQARFDVAHDAARPFSVHAGGQTVVATGTAFNVDLLGPQVLVTLIKGHVVVVQDRDARAVGAPATASDAVELEAGQQFAAGHERAPKVVAVSTDKATAWENGQIVVDDEPLAAVAERVSRYAAHPVVVRDERAGAMRLSGVFNVGDVPTFVDAVTRYLPVHAKTLPDGEIDLRGRG
jgi:transmembrane sensor